MSNSFDFKQFKANAIEQLKAGVHLSIGEGCTTAKLMKRKQNRSPSRQLLLQKMQHCY